MNFNTWTLNKTFFSLHRDLFTEENTLEVVALNKKIKLSRSELNALDSLLKWYKLIFYICNRFPFV